MQDSSSGHSNSLSNPPNDIQRNNMSAPPSRDLGNNTRFNQSAAPPQNFENSTQDGGSIKMNNQGLNQQTYTDGTLILSANGLMIYKIS